MRNSPNKIANYMLNLSGKYFYFINKKKPIKMMGFLLFMRYFVFTMILINVSSMNFANYIIVNSCKRPNQIHQINPFPFLFNDHRYLESLRCQSRTQANISLKSVQSVFEKIEEFTDLIFSKFTFCPLRASGTIPSPLL